MKRYYLILEKEQTQKSIFPLEGSVTIGRSSKNEIPLLDRAVSRAHARMRFQKGAWVIEDLGSTNGIFFSGQRVARKPLRSGDVFQIGRTTLRFVETDSQAEFELLFDTLERFDTTIMYESKLLQAHTTQSRLERLIKALRSIPAFKSLGDRELEGVATAANLHLFSSGATIIKEKGKDRSLYILLEGRIRVFTTDQNGKVIQLAVLGKNKFFGEVALLTGDLRSTSVEALEKSLLAEFTYNSVRRLMLHYPQVNEVLRNSFRKRVEDTKKKRVEAEIEERPRLPETQKITHQDRKQDSKPREHVPGKRFVSKYTQALLSIAALLVLVLLGVRLFALEPEPVSRQQITLDQSDPTELLMDIQEALEQYSTAHKERYPERLALLLPHYLVATEETHRLLPMLDYRLDDGEGYRIRIKASATILDGVLVATAEDIYMSGEENSP
jgi:CRP-like cAMP-binding protein